MSSIIKSVLESACQIAKSYYSQAARPLENIVEKIHGMIVAFNLSIFSCIAHTTVFGYLRSNLHNFNETNIINVLITSRIQHQS